VTGIDVLYDDKLLQRFWSKIVKTPYCWLWIGSLDKDGYPGWFWLSGNKRTGYIRRRAHRFAYELFKGPIPTGLVIDHLCLTPACVNPDHLEAVTVHENTMRSGIAGAAVNFRKTECKRGHPLSGENLWINSNGERICRICKHAIWHRWHRKKLANQ
jgi:hypothetical protein